MAAGDRPLRTIKALAKLFGSRWDSVSIVEVGDIKLHFVTEPTQLELPTVIPAEAAPAKKQEDKPLPEPPLNDADLALSPPAGMLLPPPPAEEQN